MRSQSVTNRFYLMCTSERAKPILDSILDSPTPKKWKAKLVYTEKVRLLANNHQGILSYLNSGGNSWRFCKNTHFLYFFQIFFIRKIMQKVKTNNLRESKFLQVKEYKHFSQICLKTTSFITVIALHANKCDN